MRLRVSAGRPAFADDFGLVLRSRGIAASKSKSGPGSARFQRSKILLQAIYWNRDHAVSMARNSKRLLASLIGTSSKLHKPSLRAAKFLTERSLFMRRSLAILACVL